MGAPRKTDPSDTYIGLKHLTGLLVTSQATIRELAIDGVVVKDGRGKYKLRESVQNYIEQLRAQAMGYSGREDVGDYQVERTRLTSNQADKAEIEARALRGEYVAIIDVENDWTNQLAAFRAKIIGIPNKLAAELHGIETKQEIEKHLKRYLYDALEELEDTLPNETDA